MFDGSRLARVLIFILAASMAFGGALALSHTGAAQTPANRPQQPPAQQPTRPPDNDTAIDDDEVLTVDTSLTNVIFTAVDKNKRFLTDLKQEDIRVYEDGAEQQIFTFKPQTDLPLTLAILIDTSISQERTLPEEKAAARAFIDAVMRPSKDEVAVLSFTGDSTLEQGLTGNAARVRSAIDRVEFVPPSGYIGRGVLVGTPPISGDNQMTCRVNRDLGRRLGYLRQRPLRLFRQDAPRHHPAHRRRRHEQHLETRRSRAAGHQDRDAHLRHRHRRQLQLPGRG
jgi:VWFA-related protein